MPPAPTSQAPHNARLHERRRLNSSASAMAARLLTGIAARRASTAWLSRNADVLRLVDEANMPAHGSPLVLVLIRIGEARLYLGEPDARAPQSSPSR
jgi:hypothetical protein